MKKLGLFTLAATAFLIANNSYAIDFYVSPTGSDANNCKSVAGPCKTIQEAHNKAVAGDTIKVQQGSYTFAGCQIMINKPLTIEGGYNSSFNSQSNDASTTVIDAESSRASRGEVCRVFAVNSGHDNWFVLDTLTITGVQATSASLCTYGLETPDPSDDEIDVPCRSHDGAILTYDIGGLIRLNNVSVLNNKMSQGHGALSINVPGDKVEITESRINDNSASQTGGAIYMAPKTKLSIANTALNNNVSGGDGGAIFLSENSELSIDTSQFYANKTPTSANYDGGAIYVEVNNSGISKVSISNSAFSENEAKYEGGAIAFNGNNGANNKLQANIENTTFDSNVASHGGAISHWSYGAGSENTQKLIIKNSTFFNNSGPGYGGALSLTHRANTEIYYSTFYGNKSNAGGAIRLDVNAPSLDLMGNLIIGNTKMDGTTANNIVNNDAAAKLFDLGYNIIGLNGVDSSTINSSSYVKASTSFAHSGVASDLINTSLEANGGPVKTLALKKASIARDAIPNDAIPFYGVGRSAQYPFTSLAQAHGALKSFENYEAGIYYFDLGATYADAADEYEPTYGPTSGQFSTFVDDNGWVLIASSNVNQAVIAPYAVTDNLAKKSDSVLNSGILSNANFVFDEVRVATESMDIAEPFDIRSSNQNVISAIKDFKMLPNNYAHDPKYGQGGWVALTGAKHIDESLVCSNNHYVFNQGTPDPAKEEALNISIYHSCGNPEGIVWMPDVNGETQNWGNGPYGADMNLWVRSANALCNGAITTTDGRGLPRADFKNPNDASQNGEVHNCDIGAFEYNNGYRYDCYAEDGKRPENYVDFDAGSRSGSASHQSCLGGDIFNATPKALLDSYGSINYYYFLLLSSLWFFRKRKA